VKRKRGYWIVKGGEKDFHKIGGGKTKIKGQGGHGRHKQASREQPGEVRGRFRVSKKEGLNWFMKNKHEEYSASYVPMGGGGLMGTSAQWEGKSLYVTYGGINDIEGCKKSRGGGQG